jgi:hypothetical protein
MPAEPDIGSRAGLVLATQRHIIRAGKALPSSHGQRLGVRRAGAQEHRSVQGSSGCRRSRE